MIRFFLLFLTIQAVLFGVEMLAVVQTAVVQPWTSWVAKASALIVHMFDPSVISQGRVLQSAKTGFGVSIEPGCNGIEACIVLFAAVMAFPSTWRHKLTGLALGFVAVQGLNMVRVISLFYLGQWSTPVFNFAHEYLWQALIMLDVLIVWLLWVRAGSKAQAASEPPPPPDEPPAPPSVRTAAPQAAPAGPLVSSSLDLSPPVRPAS